MTAHAAEFFTLDEVKRIKIIQEIQQPLYRRACCGELIHIDGCDHLFRINHTVAQKTN